eukprot:g75778.t1
MSQSEASAFRGPNHSRGGPCSPLCSHYSNEKDGVGSEAECAGGEMGLIKSGQTEGLPILIKVMWLGRSNRICRGNREYFTNYQLWEEPLHHGPVTPHEADRCSSKALEESVDVVQSGAVDTSRVRRDGAVRWREHSRCLGGQQALVARSGLAAIMITICYGEPMARSVLVRRHSGMRRDENAQHDTLQLGCSRSVQLKSRTCCCFETPLFSDRKQNKMLFFSLLLL